MRPSFRYSLRTLLGLTMLCAIAFALVAQARNRCQAESQAVSQLVGDGVVLMQTASSGPKWWREAVGDRYLPEVRLLVLRYVDLDQQRLAPLAALRRLETLELIGLPIQDSDLAALKALPRLETLALEDMPITDAGLQHVAALGTLKRLTLEYTQVTDEGIDWLHWVRPELHVERL